MEGTARNGLPRSFVDDSFFRDHVTNPFHDINPSINHRRFASNSRLFDNDFFENANRGFGFGTEPSFFRSSLPRRYSPTMHKDNGFVHPIPVQRQQPTPQPSPSMQRKNFSDQPTQHSPKFNHQRQSSSTSNYDGSNTRNANFQQQQQPQPSSNNKNGNIHVIHVQHQPQQAQNIVEINNCNPSSYMNGQLNPDRRKRDDTNSSPSRVPEIHLEDCSEIDKKDDVNHISPAISEKAIPLPPPESMSLTPQIESIPFEISESNSSSAQEDSNSQTSFTDGTGMQDIKDLIDGKTKQFVPLASTGEQLISLLDSVERHVEQFRESASQLEQEKELLLDMLNNVKLSADALSLKTGEKDDLHMTTDRLLKRCKAVDVVVNTPRNEDQTCALAEVDRMINNVVEKIHENTVASKEAVGRFLNACNPDEPTGAIDQRFQSKVVECTADDQKKIRRRLAHIIKQIESMEQDCPQTQ